MIRRIIYFFAWIGIFLFSLLGIAYAVSTSFRLFFVEKFINFPDVPRKFFLDKIFTFTPFSTRLLIFLISLAYLLLCIFKIIFKPNKNSNYEIRTADGVVTVSPSIITNYVRDIFKDDDEIKNLKVETMRSDKKFDIKIKTDISTDGNVAQKSIDMQNKIKNDIANRIGINIGEVEIKISKLISKKPVKTTKKNSTDLYISTSKTENNYEKNNTITTSLKAPTVEEPKIEEPKKEKKSFFGLFKKKVKKDDENENDENENGENANNENINNEDSNNKYENNENIDLNKTKDDSESFDTESDDKDLY
jgi:uncharacterized alkaline shock family protein YloU